VGVSLSDAVLVRDSDDRVRARVSGDGEGNIIVLDSRSGKYLWHYQVGVGLRSRAEPPIWSMAASIFSCRPGVP
jgi:hypothetical protein